MAQSSSEATLRSSTEAILGYLNYSEGRRDPKFFKAWNDFWKAGRIYSRKSDRKNADPAHPWSVIIERLIDRLDELAAESPAFRNSDQARKILRLLDEKFLYRYLEFHHDLLLHWKPIDTCQPYFLARCCEVLLAAQTAGNDDTIVDRALTAINDYVGYRPTAVLESKTAFEPYEHEFICPVPLYIRGAGTGEGKFRRVVEEAIKILQRTPKGILEDAMLDLELLDELAYDPRPYDFTHPAHRRPNYQFGTWDFRRIDQNGYFRRYVVQGTILDCILKRVEEAGDIPRQERLFEAGAVLAGTILMGSGVAGNRPDAHSSQTSLPRLLERIAGYRDVFYEHLLRNKRGKHGKRLRQERAEKHQAFASARQSLNSEISKLRAKQEIHLRLAGVFARLGEVDLAFKHALKTNIVSGRIQALVEAELVHANELIGEKKFTEALDLLDDLVDLIERGIECGALADPWNILGFSGNYPLFINRQESTRDDRIDVLIHLVRKTCESFGRLWKEAVAADETKIEKMVANDFYVFADWWDQFGSDEVEDVPGFSALEMWEAHERGTKVLREWRAAGSEKGDIAFWRDRVEHFDSAENYALIVETLLDHNDLAAAMALLVHWASRGEEVSFGEGMRALYAFCLRWIFKVWRGNLPDLNTHRKRWELTRRFIDFLEANSEQYWRAPQFGLTPPGDIDRMKEDYAYDEYTADDDVPPELEGASDEFLSAFRDAVERLDESFFDDLLSGEKEFDFQDSGEDGSEGAVADDQNPLFIELSSEFRYLTNHLLFLMTVARLWYHTAMFCFPITQPDKERYEVFENWRRQAAELSEKLVQLAETVYRFPIPRPRSGTESIIEFDQLNVMRLSFCERVVDTAVAMADAERALTAAIPEDFVRSDDGETPWGGWLDEYRIVFRAMLHGDAETVSDHWPALLEKIHSEPILYVHLARGGQPSRLFAAVNLHRALGRLLRYAPCLGLITETLQLLQAIRRMEEESPLAPASVTEYDRMYDAACRGIFDVVLEVLRKEYSERKASARSMERKFDVLHAVVERLLKIWLEHAESIRVSSAEPLRDPEIWQMVKQFIERYGAGLFTQDFMSMPNLRGILQEGIDEFLKALCDDTRARGISSPLVDDLESGKLPWRECRWCLQIIFETILENYAEYIDYNGITTQSDYGQNLYMLLDFLRQAGFYQRTAWNLRPIFLAHEVLMQRDERPMAAAWEVAVRERTRIITQDLLAGYRMLSLKYGIHLPSLYDLFRAGFSRQLVEHDLMWLAKRALTAENPKDRRDAVNDIVRLVEKLLDEISGFHYRMADWIEALEETIHHTREKLDVFDEETEIEYLRPRMHRLTSRELLRQLESWQRH